MVKEDCASYGYGRKKWWAEQIGVPQLTISHWFANRQLPNAKNLKSIQNELNELHTNKASEALREHLWELYYQDFNVDSYFIKFATIEILKAKEIDSRTLGLLSFYIERLGAFDFKVPSENNLRNKLGWLLETAKVSPSFEPAKLKEPLGLIKLSIKPLNKDLLISYLSKQQTKLGRKWHVFDCPINQIKENLIWKQNTDKLSVF